MCDRFSSFMFIIKQCFVNLYWCYVLLFSMLNIHILCLYNISYISKN